MKVLVLGSEKSDFFAHNVAHALRKMGHTVVSDALMGSDTGKSRLRRGVDQILAQSSSSWANRDDRRALSITKKERPTLVIACTRTYEPDIINEIKKIGSIVVCWYGDSPANIQRDHITSGEYDAVYVKDKRFAKDMRNILGLNVYHLNEACNPDWHKPVNVLVEGHIAVAGTMYGYRNQIVRRLLMNKWQVQLFGPLPSPWVPAEILKEHKRIFLDHRNKAIEFGRALACLNTFSPAERDSLNCRIFETCGCGGLLVSEHKAAMDECFDPNVEYLPFITFDELCEQLERVRKDRKFAARLRSNASSRAHAEHTYIQRLEVIFSTLGL